MTTQHFYRNLLADTPHGLCAFTVRVEQTDLYILAQKPLSHEARESILVHRHHLTQYLDRHPGFVTRLTPWPADMDPKPDIVDDMIEAGRSAGVGPMAAVAGAMAERVGRDLMALSPQVLVENGGDIFFNLSEEITLSVYAHESPLSLKVGLRIAPCQSPLAVCTSSGTVGHSLSMGVADAVCVMADTGALADAAATAIGNRVLSAQDCNTAAQLGKNIPGIQGVLIIAGNNMAAWGDVELVRV